MGSRRRRHGNAQKRGTLLYRIGKAVDNMRGVSDEKERVRLASLARQLHLTSTGVRLRSHSCRDRKDVVTVFEHVCQEMGLLTSTECQQGEHMLAEHIAKVARHETSASGQEMLASCQASSSQELITSLQVPPSSSHTAVENRPESASGDAAPTVGPPSGVSTPAGPHEACSGLSPAAGPEESTSAVSQPAGPQKVSQPSAENARAPTSGDDAPPLAMAKKEGERG